MGLLRYFGNLSSVRLRCEPGVILRSQNPSADQVLFSRGMVTFSVEAGKLRVCGDEIEDTLAEPPIQASSADGRSLLAITDGAGKWHSYRGVIVLRLDGSRLRVINRLAVEDYLAGVLPAEMPSAFKEEALKAQAVAARTYAYRALGKHRSSGFDVCDGSHCQIYLGVEGEKPACSRAALDTEGVILADGAGLITPLYCADCGGRTRSGGSAYSRLVSVVDAPEDGGSDFCAAGISHAWTATVSADRLVQAISRIARVATVESLSLSDPGPDERPERLLARFDGGEKEISLDALRTVLGGNVLKSSWVTAVSLQGEKVVFEGRGHGHGYGMCQTGANGMASPPHGKNFKEILAHYYPGARLTTIAELPAVARLNGRGSSAPPQRKELRPLTLFEP